MSSIFVTANEYLGGVYPSILPPLPSPELLDKIWIEPPETSLSETEFKLVSRLLFEETIELKLPGADAISLVIAAGQSGTIVPFEIDIRPVLKFRLLQVPIALRIADSLLQPMLRIPNTNPPRYEVDQSRDFIEIELASVGISISSENALALEMDESLSSVSFTQPVRIVGTEIVIDPEEFYIDASGETKCLAFQWKEKNLNSWLGRFTSTLVDEGQPFESTITLRMIFQETVEEIRFDWSIDGTGRTFSLPGVKVDIPGSTMFSVLLGAGTGGINDLALMLTLAKNSKIAARSTFAWLRDGSDGNSEPEREMNNDDEQTDKEKSLFALSLEAKEPVSLALMQINLEKGGLPTFLKQLDTPLKKLDLNDAETLCQPTPFELVSLDGDDWGGEFSVDPEAFNFPFLKDKNDNPSANQFSQVIQIKPPQLGGQTLSKFTVDFEEKSIGLPLDAQVKFGPLALQTQLVFKFNWESFAISIDHGDGVSFHSSESVFPKPNEESEHMGLSWRFEGAKVDGTGLYHYFTLVTKGYAYELQQAKGAKFVIAYTKASKEPIEFNISNFSLTPKGVTLTAEVADNPVRMNGINTRFRFSGSKLTIVENRIADFTLAGSGPLPPDLVGEAMVDIALQFKQQNGNLTLVSGGAQLKGNKLLDCKNTRFQFSIDAIGLDFVNENGFHLYFKLTGSARFVLAPGDDGQGALAWLPNIKIDLVDAPLTGDVSVLAKHIKFLVELPKPLTFSFLGAFEMELRGIGFVPSAKEFDGDAAMELTGQLRFAQGAGDTPDPRTDYHRLLIGLPKPGSIFPRIFFKRIALNINIGAAFKLNGYVEFIDDDLMQGFEGEGSIELQGMPSIAASFAFLRVRRDENSTWLRAWFIYLEVRRFSLQIPVIQIYLREVGLGFGYRFTLASIKVADRENDVKKLLKELQKLSRTQGDLSKRDRWELDLEAPGEDVRWTIVFRALISQTSAAPSPLQYNEGAEKLMACLFLIDAIIAFRSDLTFFMAARAWFYTNYYEFDSKPVSEVKEKPFLSGFVLLSPRRKRFLMHVASNKEGYIGGNPPLPDFVKAALRSVRFSATLLVEPGLVHFELGWPNMLGWDFDIGPLHVSIRGGFIFRVSREEFAIGISYAARGKLDVKAEVDLGLVGVRVSVYAEVGYGARLIAIIKFQNGDFFIYGGIGLEMRVVLAIEFWIKIPLVFTTIKLNFRFSIGIAFTAGLEAGLTNANGLGLRGRGTLALSAMGHSIQFSASFAFNDGAVNAAELETRRILDMGMEATDVDPVPGLGEPANLQTDFEAGVKAGGTNIAAAPRPLTALRATRGGTALRSMIAPLAAARAFDIQAVTGEFHIPGYSIFVIRKPDRDGWSHFVLLPQGETQVPQADGSVLNMIEPGFLPAPPLNLRVKLVYFNEALNRGQLPDELLALFTGQFALNPDKIFISPQSSKQWQLFHTLQTQTGTEQTFEQSIYQITLESTTANPAADPRATLDAVRLSHYKRSAKQMPNVVGATTTSVSPSPALDEGMIYALLTMVLPQGSAAITEMVIAGFDGQIATVVFNSGTVRYTASIRVLSFGFFNFYWRIYTVQQLSSIEETLDNTVTQVFAEKIAADRQTYQLRGGQLPKEVADILADATDIQEDTASPTWRWTAQKDGSVYSITKSPDPRSTNNFELRYMDIRLEVINDFTLTIPLTEPEYLFSIPAALATQLDASTVSDDLRAAFKNFNTPLHENPQITVETPGAAWILTDTITDAGRSIEVRYTIESEDDFLNVSGDMTLEQYNPISNTWESRVELARTGGNVSWQAQWDANIYDGGEYATTPVDLQNQKAIDQQNAQLRNSTPQDTPILLGRYLNHAFKLDDFTNNFEKYTDELDQVIPVGDPPMPTLKQKPLEDDRVYNPSDNAFEAAVRGAVEQFEGSPFFKRDPNNEYDRLLGDAFASDTTIYDSTGALPTGNNALQAYQNQQQAVQLRGMVIHDLVADLRDYADSRATNPTNRTGLEFNRDRAIAFQMGLAFRFRGKPPAWLDDLIPSDDEKLAVQQRRGPFQDAPNAEQKPANTFNVWQTDFAKNPPQFQRVRQYTNASTIAITWDLIWPQQPRPGVTPNQAEPEHHLLQYHIQRRALDGSERDITFTLKNAEALHRQSDEELITRLRPRFQLVDHFTSESDKELADLPITGRSYLYTITPLDFENNAGRPLTIVATRRPSIPPLVPVDGELIVRYKLSRAILAPEAAAEPAAPQIVAPHAVEIRWQEPYDTRSENTVPIANYRLLFRREGTLPIGSYGLDSTTQRPAAKVLPTTNARRLPTDIVIDIDTSTIVEKIHEGEEIIRKGAVISLDDLRTAGVLPEDEWRAESWRVFFQTESVNLVPSALAPVQLLLRVEPEAGAGYEDRRPAELEWLVDPINFPLLPPEDERAVVGMAHFPMPGQSGKPSSENDDPSPDGNFRFGGSTTNVGFRLHPAEIRVVRFRWNQGPSDQPDYPLDLNAGYHLYELDADANTTATFKDAEKLRDVLRDIQEVQMLPAEDLLLVPGETLAVSQWEAWYPSIIKRLRSRELRAAKRSKTVLGPWFSWRDSMLNWPPPALREDDFTSGVFSVDLLSQIAKRKLAMHPALRNVVTALERIFTVDLQNSPPLQPTTLDDFFASTSTATDPYGWNVLQHFGLSIAFTVRKRSSGDLITGDDLLKNVETALLAGLLQLALIDDIRAQLSNDKPTQDAFEAQILPLSQAQIVSSVQAMGGVKGILILLLEAVDALVTTLNGAANIDANLKQAVLNNLTTKTKTALEAFMRYLHVELLFQPGRSIDLKKREAEGADMLALVQVSLRPIVSQYLRYSKLHISGPAKGAITLFVTLGASNGVPQPCSYINQSDPASGQTELEPDGTQVITNQVVLPMNGEAALYFRSTVTPSVEISLTLEQPLKSPIPVDLGEEVQYVEAVAVPPQSARLKINPSFSNLSRADRKRVFDSLGDNDQKKAAILLSLKFSALVEVPPTDESEIAEAFVVPANLPTLLSSNNPGSGFAAWYRLKYYLESLNGESTPKIVLPTNAAGETSIEKLLTDFITWSQRFFNAGGLLKKQAGLSQTDIGPWLATGYPRAGSPAYATPDEGGRLKYDHIYEDKYAHNYRYYVQPYGRYDLLWHSFRKSPALAGDQIVNDDDVMRPAPNPDGGGLDIVIDRTQAVDMPVILNSARLDPVTNPGQPVPPGKTWEVIIAQHPEQSLIERNQTLARQLAFRQIAFTLLRRYGFEDWLLLLNTALKMHNPEAETIVVTAVHHQAQTPDLPGDYPALPDHIDFTPEKVTPEEIRGVALPTRIGRFQQGALVLQWESLPFYYEHRLLVIAQTATTVSDINEISQRDFEYRSPNPRAVVEGREKTAPIHVVGVELPQPRDAAFPARLRRIEIPLRPFWESLTDATQQRWQDETPDLPGSDALKRKFSSLPDPDVIYQLVETFNGNVEVQVEVFFGRVADEVTGEQSGDYQFRQLGRSFLAVINSLTLLPPDTLHDDFVVALEIVQLTPIPLTQTYQLPTVISRSFVYLKDVLHLVGAFTASHFEIWQTLLDAADEKDIAQIAAVYAQFVTREPVSESPELPEALQPEAAIEEDTITHLVWDSSLSEAENQTISDAEKTALLGLTGDEAFVKSIARLVKAIEAGAPKAAFYETAPLPPELQDDEPPSGFKFEAQDTGYQLSYTGILTDNQKADLTPALYTWAKLPELRRAADELLVKLDEAVGAVPNTRVRLTADDIPDDLKDLLTVEGDTYSFVREATPTTTAALQTLISDHPGSDLAVTLTNLVTILNRNFTKVFTADELPDELPEILKERLKISTLEGERRRVEWIRPAPNDAEREALNALMDDGNFNGLFRRAVRELLDQINNIPAALLPRGALDLTSGSPLDILPDTYADLLQLLTVNPQNGRIRWSGGGVPTDKQRELLNALIADEAVNGRFRTALAHLLAIIDAVPVVTLPPLPVSPLAQLAISEIDLRWTGRVRTDADANTLAAAGKSGDAQFEDDIKALIAALKANVVAVEVAIAPRPSELPPKLEGKLIISQRVLRYGGLMTTDEGNELHDLFEKSIDKNAVQRLYTKNINSGLRDRAFKIRARRGGASPSLMNNFASKPLDATENEG